MGKKSGKQQRDQIEDIENLRKGILRSRAKGDYKELSNLHNQLGNIYRIREEYEDAIEQHKEEARVTREHFPEDVIGLAVAYRNIGEVYIDMKDEDTAAVFITKYLRLAKAQNNLIEEQRAHITLGRICLGLVDKYTENEANDPEASHKRTVELTNAERQFTRAYEILDKSELKSQLRDRELAEMRCGAYLNLGITFDLGEQSDEAIKWIEKSIAVAKTFGFFESLHRCYSVMYATYLKLEKYNDLYTTAKILLKISKQLGDKCQEFEARFLEAKALFMLNEIEKGVNILKRIRKQIQKNESALHMLEEIDPMLTSGIRIFNAEDDKIATEEHDLQKLKSLYEIKGDNYVTLGNFQEAIKNYLQSISYAEKLNLTAKQLGALYYSLAVTYKDCGEYENALKYFRKEMKIYEGNKIEEFRTQTNIADCLEKADKPADMVLQAYQVAVQLSKNFPRKHITSLKNVAQYCKAICDNESADKYLKKAHQLEVLHPCSNSDEDDSQELLLDDDTIDLDNLSIGGDSETEGEEEIEGSLPRNTTVVRRSAKFRKNEKGETPLHIAAQKGDLKGVRRLLANGHEVNPMDFSGWIPLHEACNFGHLDIVVELLKHNADVNSCGGKECNGVTPIHDAASNGHISVMRVLLQHGASAYVRDKEGNRPVDSLVGWYERERSTGSLTDDQIQEYDDMKKYLIDLMKKCGKTYTKKDEEFAKRRNALRRTPSPVFSTMKTDKFDETVPITIKVVHPDADEGRAGVSEYNEAMRMFRRKDRTMQRTLTEVNASSSKDALLAESQYIDGDWMIPDETLAQDSSKPKRKRDPFDDFKPTDRSTRRKREEKKREEKQNVVEQMDIIIDDDSNKSRSQEIVVKPLEPTLRLKIEILETKILVPVMQLDETIEWLCQEAADRYYKQSGQTMKLKLTLKTKDGAILSRADRIRDAISELDTELIATIEDYTLQDSSTRFEAACKKFNIEANVEAVRALIRSQTTEGLVVTDISLRGKISEALFQTLQHNCYIRELNLAGCSLKDEGLKRLCSVMSTLSGLEKLDISCNGLTHEGLGKLTEMWTKTPKPGQSFKLPVGIKTLIMDHNPVGNSIACLLFQIIPKLHNLQTLSLIDCNLTAAFFSKNKKDFVNVINSSSIKVLNVSYNHLGKGGIQIFRTEISSNRLEVVTICCEQL